MLQDMDIPGKPLPIDLEVESENFHCENQGVKKEMSVQAFNVEPANIQSTQNSTITSPPRPLAEFGVQTGSQDNGRRNNNTTLTENEHVQATKKDVTRNSTSRTLNSPRAFDEQQKIRSTTVVHSPETGIHESSGLQTTESLVDLDRQYSRYPQHHASRIGQAIDHSLTASTKFHSSSDLSQPDNSQEKLVNFGLPNDDFGAPDSYYGKEKSFILHIGETEADDNLHTPMHDDDAKFKPKLSQYFSRRSLVSLVGGFFLILGLLFIFIVFPVLSYATNSLVPYKKRDMKESKWNFVNNRKYPLLKNFRTGLIDPDTPPSARTRKSAIDGSNLQLVFSDEFNKNNRTFYQGNDPFWTAADMWYGATQDLEWYDPDAVTTGGGTLQLKLDAFENGNLKYRSGMLNSWNQLCFKGGVMEVSVSMPGPSGYQGLWPAVWTLGNLARPGYLATTDGVWPYTYDTCDLGITPNQSDSSGISHLPGQRLNSCTCKGEDHPSPGTGRGAPEIDVIEASVDPNNHIGVVIQSLQIAPSDIFYQPNSEFIALPNYETTQMNLYTGGPFQETVSAVTLLNNNWYDGKAYQKYAFEYIPGTSEGKIVWFVGEEPTMMLDGRALGPNGNVAARQISQEPMSLTLNLGLSYSWSDILLENLKFPTTMHIDYVRLYQPAGNISVTCDPPGYPTTEFIKAHPLAYQNPNKTSWDDTGYAWPKNEMQNDCAT